MTSRWPTVRLAQDRSSTHRRPLTALAAFVPFQVAPQLSADLVEGLGRPGDHVEGIEADLRVQGSGSDHGADPLGPVGGDDLQVSGSFRAQGVEERADRGLRASLGDPHHPTGRMGRRPRSGTAAPSWP